MVISVYVIYPDFSEILSLWKHEEDLGAICLGHVTHAVSVSHSHHHLLSVGQNWVIFASESKLLQGAQGETDEDNWGEIQLPFRVLYLKGSLM